MAKITACACVRACSDGHICGGEVGGRRVGRTEIWMCASTCVPHIYTLGRLERNKEKKREKIENIYGEYVRSRNGGRELFLACL